jgi:hypothetical protein
MTPHLVAPAGRGGAVTIACINKAKTPLGVPFDALTAALQKCYDQFFVPVWGFPVTLYNTDHPRPSDWRLVYFDDAEQAGFLGYHELTDEGQPISKVFVSTTLKAGEQISVTASHELFEMAIDPIANLWAERHDGVAFAYEMCDPVEEDVFMVDGMAMSNFVHPAWFEPFDHPTGTKYDHLERLNAPFSMSKGGYVVIKKNGKVLQQHGSTEKAQRFALENRLGHRSEYRKRRGLQLKPGLIAAE